MIQQLNRALIVGGEKDMREGMSGWTAYYNKEGKGKMKGKTLLICKEDIKNLTPADIEKNFHGKYEIATKARLKEVIAKGDNKYCYLQPISDDERFLMMVVDPQSGDIISMQPWSTTKLQTSIDAKFFGKFSERLEDLLE